MHAHLAKSTEMDLQLNFLAKKGGERKEQWNNLGKLVFVLFLGEGSELLKYVLHTLKFTPFRCTIL